MDIFEPVLAWRRASEIRRELNSRSDRQLQDLGMSRDMIAQFAKNAARK